ncbi:MAG: glycosyltransferase [Geminicoccaceae bacterium]
MSVPIVVFGEDWGSHPSSTQHLVRRLMCDHSIIWVNSIGLRRPRTSWLDLRRAATKLVRAIVDLVDAGRTSAVHADRDPWFEVVNPLALPARSDRVGRRVNRALLGMAVRRVLRRRSVEAPILWISLPTAVDVVGALQEHGVVYYCGDDWGAMPGVDHARIKRLEAELAQKAHLILAASPVIAAKFPPEKVVVLSHGVDLDQFGTVCTARPHDLPDDAPIAGFYGMLSGWLDVALLVHAAEALPQWRFFLIGPIRTDVSALAALPNVILAGARRHDELPAYVQHWDVSLLPFADNAMTRAFNPLKLREYLAAGTPIAATPLAALEPYGDLIEVGRTPMGFVAAIRSAGAEGRSRAEARRQRVAPETWERRAEEVETLLGRLRSGPFASVGPCARFC